MPGPRRYLRFSLSTLLAVIALIAGWFAWQIRIVSTRQHVAHNIVRHGGQVGFTEFVGDVQPRRLPFYRYWLGDRDVYWLVLKYPCEYSEEQVQAIFPETEILCPY